MLCNLIIKTQTLNFEHESSPSPQPGPTVGAKPAVDAGCPDVTLLPASDLLQVLMAAELQWREEGKAKDRKGLI